MIKQSEAKERQGYDPKPLVRCCGTCASILFDMDWPEWMKDGKHDNYLVENNKIEKNVRCGIGNFAVKKTAVCNGWKVKG